MYKVYKVFSIDSEAQWLDPDYVEPDWWNEEPYEGEYVTDDGEC